MVGNCNTVTTVTREMRRLYRGYWACVGKACGTVFSVGGGWLVAFSAQMQLAVVQFCLIIFRRGGCSIPRRRADFVGVQYRAVGLDLQSSPTRVLCP